MHRVQKSDAAVGIGTLIGDRDYIARKQKSWFDSPQNSFMFFDRNEIHIQDFGEIPPAKLMSGDSSSSTFHHFQEFIISHYQKFRNSESQKFKKWTHQVSEISKFLSFRFPQKMFPHFVPGMFPDFSEFFESILV